MTEPDKLYCNACGHVFPVDEAGPPVYECSTCGQPQAGEDDDARRCQQCHKFAAKVADRSCPECEAPDEELRGATAEDVARFERDKAEAEERRRNPPPPDPKMQEYMERRRQEQAEYRKWWEKTGRDAFSGLDVRDGEAEVYGRDLAERIELIIVEAESLSTTLDRQEIRAIGDALAEGKEV